MVKKIIMLLIFTFSNLIFSIELKTAAQDSAPKFFVKPNKKNITGICIDVMRAIENIQPDIKFKGDQFFLPFNRIEIEVENGTLDCFVGFAKNKEREKKYIFIDIPIYYVKDILISRKDDKVEIKALEDIKKLDDNTIVVAMGTIQADKLKAEGYNIDESGKSSEINVKKLLIGRGRFIYQSEIELIDTIKKMNVKNEIKIQPLITQTTGRYIAFSKKTPKDVIDKVNKAMEKLKNTGKLDEIFKKYVGTL